MKASDVTTVAASLVAKANDFLPPRVRSCPDAAWPDRAGWWPDASISVDGSARLPSIAPLSLGLFLARTRNPKLSERVGGRLTNRGQTIVLGGQSFDRVGTLKRRTIRRDCRSAVPTSATISLDRQQGHRFRASCRSENVCVEGSLELYRRGKLASSLCGWCRPMDLGHAVLCPAEEACPFMLSGCPGKETVRRGIAVLNGGASFQNGANRVKWLTVVRWRGFLSPQSR